MERKQEFEALMEAEQARDEQEMAIAELTDKPWRNDFYYVLARTTCYGRVWDVLRTSDALHADTIHRDDRQAALRRAAELAVADGQEV